MKMYSLILKSRSNDDGHAVAGLALRRSPISGRPRPCGGAATSGRNDEKPDTFGYKNEETNAVSAAPMNDESTLRAPYALTI